MDGQGQLHGVLRRCIKQCLQLYRALALAELEVAKRASLSGRFAPWEEPHIRYKQENSMWIVVKREL